ncbi:MAG: acyl-CoA dehydrogenase [Nocardioidaceae bacterium]|nr:acyl-CoA dehydrogenase [Nocardioidaceae bacterium]
MEFTFDTEQIALRDAVRGLLRSRDDVPADQGFDPAMWTKLAAMGVLGLPFSEDVGGMGAGPIEVMIVAQELGRVLAPEPYVDSVVLAGGLIAAAGSDEQHATLLAALAEGESQPILAHAEPRTRWGTDAYGVVATSTTDGWTIDGTKEPVLYGDSATVLLVSALVGEQTKLFVVDPDEPGVTRTAYATHDGRRVARITFTKAAATPLGDAPADSSVLKDAFAQATIALCAEALGAMEVALDTTVGYLKTRKQFGVPLSKFQALTHRAADMYVSLELARSVVQYGAMCLAEGVEDPLVASRVKLQVSRSARHIGQEAIQLHGGIGMTDEYTIGHYTNRLTAMEHSLGDATFHRARLAQGLDQREIVDLLG